ncbi:MAG: DUF4159 domain-containing protein [bacterium]|jgi:hypothetical protein
MQYLLVMLLSVISVFSTQAQTPGEFTIARLKYSGGGDWYENRTSLPNLLQELRTRLQINTAPDQSVITPSDSNIFNYPLLYMNGHGTVRFSERDIQNLREYFRRGGMLWADDNYGMDESFRREIARVFPDHPLVEIPHDHPIFFMYYQFDNGLPKIHEHAGGPPHLFGIFLDGRLAVIYTFNTDIGDGMESEGVHKEDSPETRELAMQMGINIAIYAMSN